MVGERLYVTPHSTHYTPRSTLHTPFSTLYTFHSTLHTLHLTLQTLHFTLCTLHFTLCTLHSTLHTLHFTLRTPPTTVYTLHCPPPTVMILSPLVHRLLEAQTICSTLGIVILALQPFATPLQTLLFRNPNGRCSPLSFGVPPFSSVFPLLRTIFLHFLSFFPTFFLSFLHFPPFSHCFQRFSFVFLGFFLPFSCRSQRT